MEPDKCHNLPSANWRPKKASIVIPVTVQKPGNQGGQWCISQSKGRRRLVSHLKQAGKKEKGQIPPSSASCSI